MAAKKVKVRKVKEEVEQTSPGDFIELSISQSVRTGGTERWVKIGLSSQHREGETTDEAIERIESFVVDGLAEMIRSM